MKFTNKQITNNEITINNSLFTNSKGDIYAISSHKPTIAGMCDALQKCIAHVNGGHFTSGPQLYEFLSEQEKLITVHNSLLTFSKRRNTMKHPADLPGGRNAKQATNNNSTNNKISKRSKIMNATQIITRGFIALLSICLVIGFAFGQNVNLTGSGGSLNGIYTVKGNINTGTASAPYSFTGTVNLSGTGGDQSIGGASGTPVNLTFATLNTTSTSTRTQTSPTVAVTTAISLAGGNYSVGAHTLNISGTSTGTSLDAGNASSAVNFTGAGAQAVLASTYGGTLGLSGAGAKTLGGNVIAAIVNHTAASGALTIDNNLTITGNSASSLDAISIAATKTLEYQGTNTLTISTVSSIAGTGVIQQTTAAGTIAFTNAFTNGGTIQTGTGTLTFNGDLTNTGGTVALTLAGTANFHADILAVGTMSFGGTSTVNYTSGSAQHVAGVTYVNLNMSGVGVKTALGAVTVNTAFNNNGTSITDMSTFALGGAGTKSQAAGATMRFGGAANGLVFTAGTVDYNGNITQTITGGSSYATLLLSGTTSTKQVLAGVTVHTTSNLTVSNAITLDVAATGVVQVDGDLNVNGTGTITNAGAITVGV